MAIIDRASAKAALDQCGRFTRDEFYELLDVLPFPEDVRGFIAVFKLNGSIKWFNNFASAVTDAVSGELIRLYKSISENCILKNGVNIDLNGFTISSDNSNGVTISDNGVAVSCVIFGMGNLKRTAITGGANGSVLAFTGTGNIKIFANEISALNGYTINLSGAGNFTIHANLISGGNGGDYGYENHCIRTHTANVKLYVYAKKIICTAVSDSHFAIYAQKGNIWAEGATIIKTETNSTCVHKHADGVLVLKDNVYITDIATAGGCIGGSGDILLYGSNTANTAEVAADPISLLVGTLNISTSVIDF